MPIAYSLPVASIFAITLSVILPHHHTALLAEALLLGAVIFLISNRSLSRNVMIIITLTGVMIVSLYPATNFENNFGLFDDKIVGECRITGRVSDITPLENQRVRITVRLGEIKSTYFTHICKKKIYVYTDSDKCANTEPGNEIIIYGNLSRPDPALNFGDFNLRKYYYSLDVIGTCYDPRELTSVEGSFYPPALLYKIRSFTSSSLNKHQESDSAAFVNAVLTGDRSGFTDELSESIRKAGISHVTAVSGMHVSILISVIMSISNLFTKRRKTKAKAAIALLLVYMAISGFSPSVIRACIMGSCCMVGVLSGRRANSLLLLLICAAVMLFNNPYLIYNPSFMLSFISSGALSIFLPIAQRIIKKRSLLTDTLMMTVIANLATLPYVLWNFDYYSWIGLLANMVIVPLISIVFIGGMLTVFLSFIPPLAILAGSFTGGIASAIVDVTEWISALPFGQITYPLHSFFYIAAYFAFGGMVYMCFTHHRRLTTLFFIVTVLLLCSGIFSHLAEQNTFSVTYLYVGQGDSTVIRTDKGDIFLIDTGDVSVNGSSKCLEYLKNKGIRRINGIFLSHEDADHAGALDIICKSIPVERIFITENSMNFRDVSAILKTAESSDAEVIPLSSGDKVTVAGQVFEILHPNAGADNLSSNEGSMVIRMNYKNKSFLFTGDISAETEMKIAEFAKDCAVLKIAHHGSSDSTSKEFLKTISPEYAVISAGTRNSYSHPHSSVIKRLVGEFIPFFITSRDGCVQFTMRRNDDLYYKKAVYLN